MEPAQAEVQGPVAAAADRAGGAPAPGGTVGLAVGYALALAAGAAVVGLDYALAAALDPHYFLLPLAAVALVGWFAGRGPAVTTTFVAALGIDLFLLAPSGGLMPVRFGDGVLLVVFLTAAFLTAGVADQFRSVARRAADGVRRADALGGRLETVGARLERLRAVADVLAGVETVDDATAVLTGPALEAVGADGALLALLGRGDDGARRVRIACAHGFPEVIEKGRVGRELTEDHALAAAAHGEEPVWLRSREDVDRALPGLAGEIGAPPIALLPLVAGDEPLGLLALRLSGPVASGVDESLALLLARSVALALARVRAGEPVSDSAAAPVDTDAMDELIVTISGDLRGSLNTIRTGIRLLRGGGTDPERREAQLALVARAADHVSGIVNGLVDMHRVEAGEPIPVEAGPLDLSELVTDARALVASRTERKRISIVPEIGADCPPVHADRDRVLQVVHNLLINAIRFTPRGGTVRVSVEPGRDRLTVSVRDSGPGIPDHARERLFDPHWREKRRARLGAGLGLPLSKAIVEAHGGRIWVDSGEDRGSTFHFTLPTAVTAALSAGGAATEERAPRTPPDPGPAGARDGGDAGPDVADD